MVTHKTLECDSMTSIDTIAKDYDLISYPSTSIPEASLQRLWAAGSVFGIHPAKPEDANILEIGCASGGHITPMAFKYPQSTFWGIDLSKNEIEKGTKRIKDLQLKNITLSCADLSDLKSLISDSKIKTFDYIIAHGVYSWVSPTVQEALINIGKSYLSKNGIFYISYNTLPGWYDKLRIRDYLIFSQDTSLSPADRIDSARKHLSEFEKSCKENKPPYYSTLKEHFESLHSAPDWYLFHEYLSTYNSPIQFAEFNKHIMKNDLYYISDTDLGSIDHSSIATSSSRFSIESEQQTDILTNRTLRRSLVSKSSRDISFSCFQSLLESSFLATPLRKSEYQENCFLYGKKGNVIINDIHTARAINIIRDSWPSSISWRQTQTLFTEKHNLDKEQLNNIISKILELYLKGALLIESSTQEVLPIKKLKEIIMEEYSPQTSLFTRKQAEASNIISGLRGERVVLKNAISRFITAILDGNRNYKDSYILLQSADVEFSKPNSSKKMNSKSITEDDFLSFWKDTIELLTENGLLKSTNEIIKN